MYKIQLRIYHFFLKRSIHIIINAKLMGSRVVKNIKTYNLKLDVNHKSYSQF